MKTLRTITLALAALFAAASAANAATISYFFNYGPEAIPQSLHNIGSLSLFNPALGTLTQVDLKLDSTTDSGSIAWENLAGVSSTVTLGIGASVNAFGQYGGLAATAVPLQLGSGSVTAYDGTTDFLGMSSFNVTGNSGSDSDTDTSTSPGVLALYTGIGTFTVDGDSSVSTFLSTSGGFGPTDPHPGNTSGTVTVTYTYVAVPEPSTFVLGGLGLLGLVGLARRKTR